jgi:2,3-bisphosphoglycerate-independent phosphoglycerate mutase
MDGQVRFSVCVCGDHASPVLYGDHSHEPVPFALCPLEALEGGGGGSGGSVTSGEGQMGFDEIAAARGVLGRFPGAEVMPLLRAHMATTVGSEFIT